MIHLIFLLTLFHPLEFEKFPAPIQEILPLVSTESDDLFHLEIIEGGLSGNQSYHLQIEDHSYFIRMWESYECIDVFKKVTCT